MCDCPGGLVGCDGMSFALDAALDDDDIDGILLHCDSPGGEVSGVFDLADEVFSGRQRKPVWALVNELAASAAYAIASGADRIIAPRTAMAGSIGVVLMHRDRSQELAKQGQTITFIHSGARKVDGNSARPLPDDVRQRLQADVDNVYGLFTRTVARNRGLDERAVRSTEAGLFGSDEALRLGLIDEIGPAATVLERFNDALRHGTARNQPSRRKAATTHAKRTASRTLDRLAATCYDMAPPANPEPPKPLNVASFYK